MHCRSRGLLLAPVFASRPFEQAHRHPGCRAQVIHADPVAAGGHEGPEDHVSSSRTFPGQLGARSVTAIATITPPTLPWVVKLLAPFSTQLQAARCSTQPYARPYSSSFR
jgi:hypothetical protein